METLQQTKQEIINLLSSKLFLSPNEGKLSVLIARVTPLLDSKRRKEQGKGYAQKTLNSKTLILTSVLLKGKLESKAVGKNKVYRMKPEYASTVEDLTLVDHKEDMTKTSTDLEKANAGKATNKKPTKTEAVESSVTKQTEPTCVVVEQADVNEPSHTNIVAAKDLDVAVDPTTTDMGELASTPTNLKELTEEQEEAEERSEDQEEVETTDVGEPTPTYTNVKELTEEQEEVETTLSKEKMHILAILSGILFIALCFYVVAMSSIIAVYAITKLAKASKDLKYNERHTPRISFLTP